MFIPIPKRSTLHALRISLLLTPPHPFWNFRLLCIPYCNSLLYLLISPMNGNLCFFVCPRKFCSYGAPKKIIYQSQFQQYPPHHALVGNIFHIVHPMSWVLVFITHPLIFARFYWILYVTWCKITGQLSRNNPPLCQYLPSDYFCRKETKPAGKSQLNPAHLYCFIWMKNKLVL